MDFEAIRHFRFLAAFTILAVSAQKSDAQNRMEIHMPAAPKYRTKYRTLSAITLVLFLSPSIMAQANEHDGIVRVQSAYAMSETISRIKKDIADKGIRFFSEIDQSKLASDAGIKLRPSTLLVFGNPPLGTQFVTSNPNAGLDWPVRLLVTQDDNGSVWTVYTDFGWIANRHGIVDREAQFEMASEVIGAITSSVAKK
jgi:uncharacterized protein (DUF302 family)